MNAPESDKKTVLKIIEYCSRILNTVERFGDSQEIFCADYDFQNSVCMNILQIGELSGRLSETFKEKYPAVDWRAIHGMRNILAHDYGSIDFERTWDTVKYDIPFLKNACEKIRTEFPL